MFGLRIDIAKNSGALLWLHEFTSTKKIIEKCYIKVDKIKTKKFTWIRNSEKNVTLLYIELHIHTTICNDKNIIHEYFFGGTYSLILNSTSHHILYFALALLHNCTELDHLHWL